MYFARHFIPRPTSDKYDSPCLDLAWVDDVHDLYLQIHRNNLHFRGHVGEQISGRCVHFSVVVKENERENNYVIAFTTTRVFNQNLVKILLNLCSLVKNILRRWAVHY